MNTLLGARKHREVTGALSSAALTLAGVEWRFQELISKW
jgi:hypothetical protein